MANRYATAVLAAGSSPCMTMTGSDATHAVSIVTVISQEALAENLLYTADSMTLCSCPGMRELLSKVTYRSRHMADAHMPATASPDNQSTSGLVKKYKKSMEAEDMIPARSGARNKPVLDALYPKGNYDHHGPTYPYRVEGYAYQARDVL